MKATDFDTLMTGAREALAHAKGEPNTARARVIDVDKGPARVLLTVIDRDPEPDGARSLAILRGATPWW